MRLKFIVYYLSYTRIHWSFVHVNMKPSEKLEIRGYIKVRCSLGITAEKFLKYIHWSRDIALMLGSMISRQRCNE
jgi:hypothetical protein